VQDVVAGARAEDVDDLAEDECHEQLCHAVGDCTSGTCGHEHRVYAIRELEQAGAAQPTPSLPQANQPLVFLLQGSWCW